MQQQESLVVHQAAVIYQGLQAHAIRNFPRNRLIFSSSTLWEETSDFASRAVWEEAGKSQQGLLLVTRLLASSGSCLCVQGWAGEKKLQTTLSGSLEFGRRSSRSSRHCDTFSLAHSVSALCMRRRVHDSW